VAIVTGVILIVFANKEATVNVVALVGGVEFNSNSRGIF